MLYYTPPSDDTFKDLQAQAIRLWLEVSNEIAYAREKIFRIVPIENFEDNFMYIFSMFDPINQKKLLTKVRSVTAHEIKRRLEN